MIINLYNYKKLPFFSQLFTTKILPLGMEAIMDYQKAINLSANTDEEVIFKELIERLEFHPENIIGSIGLALHHQNEKRLRVYVGISNFPVIDIQEIKPHMVRQFITVKGVVVKVGAIKLLPVSVDFKCT